MPTAKFDKILVGLRYFPHYGDAVIRLKQGNFVVVWVSQDELEFRTHMAFVKKHKLYFKLLGHPPSYPKLPEYLTGKSFERFRKETGEYFLGWLLGNELGSLVYWGRDNMDYLTVEPKDALKPGSYSYQVAHAPLFKGAKDMKDAHDRFMGVVKRHFSVARRLVPKADLQSVEASTLQKYLLAGGADQVIIELMPGETRLMLSATRGAARAYNRLQWTAHNASCCYAGGESPLRPKREAALYYSSYIAGARIFYREPCNFRARDYSVRDVPQGYDWVENPETEEYRKVQRDFYAFTRKDRRPAGGPITPLGILHGNLDGWCGLWDKRVWGQWGSPEWEYGDAENGWDHFYDLYTREPWNSPLLDAEQNLTGHPPFGQVDIVPIEAPIQVLRRHRGLVCLGWNTMTPAIYRKLIAYVRAGGRLMMSLAHMSTHVKRNGRFQIINRGDLSKLFGVRIKGPSREYSAGFRFIASPRIRNFFLPAQVPKGAYQYADALCIDGAIPLSKVELAGARVLACRQEGGGMDETHPILTEHRVGKGCAYLLTPWAYPGHPALRSGVQMLLRHFAVAQQDPNLKIFAPGSVDFGVYRGEKKGSKYKIYLLNTDPDLTAHVAVAWKQTRREFLLRPLDVKVYHTPVK